MSDCPGPLTAIFGPVAEAAAERSRRRAMQPPPGPDEKAVTRAVAGAVVLTACLWVSPLLRGNFSGLALGAWAFTALAGLMALMAGIRAARELVAQDALMAFWAASVFLVCGGLLLAGMVPADAEGRFIVRGLYVCGLAGAAVCLWIYSGLAQRHARREIERALARQNAPMRPARRR